MSQQVAKLRALLDRVHQRADRLHAASPILQPVEDAPAVTGASLGNATQSQSKQKSEPPVAPREPAQQANMLSEPFAQVSETETAESNPQSSPASFASTGQARNALQDSRRLSSPTMEQLGDMVELDESGGTDDLELDEPTIEDLAPLSSLPMEPSATFSPAAAIAPAEAGAQNAQDAAQDETSIQAEINRRPLTQATVADFRAREPEQKASSFAELLDLSLSLK